MDIRYHYKEKDNNDEKIKAYQETLPGKLGIPYERGEELLIVFGKLLHEVMTSTGSSLDIIKKIKEFTEIEVERDVLMTQVGRVLQEPRLIDDFIIRYQEKKDSLN